MEENKLTNFLIKLWSILDDETIADTIRWDRSGKSFHIFDLYKFCEVVLPRFFKHKNMASFVRQLNLYGFKKIATVDRSTMVYSDNLTDHMQFAHTFFRRGQPNLLKEIKRNYTAPKRQVSLQPAGQDMDLTSTGEKMVTLPESDLLCMLEELQTLRNSHSHMENTICELSRDNELLWNEVSLLRDSHVKQQHNVGKLVQFLISLVQPGPANSQTKRMGGNKRVIPIVEPAKEDNHPLALASPSADKQNWDILACIHDLQKDILSESRNYSSMSALSPPPPTDGMDQQGPSGSAQLFGGNNNIQMFGPQSSSTPKFSSISKKCYSGPSKPIYNNQPLPSPHNQLSMQLRTGQSTSRASSNFAPILSNRKQLVPATSELLRMGRNYHQVAQPTRAKPTIKRVPYTPLVEVNPSQMTYKIDSPNDYIYEQHVEGVPDDQQTYVEEYYEDEGMSLSGPPSCSMTQQQHNDHQGMPDTSFEFMDDDFIESQIEEVIQKEHSPSYLHPAEDHFEGINTSNNNNHHELMLYDAMHAVESPWQNT